MPLRNGVLVSCSRLTSRLHSAERVLRGPEAHAGERLVVAGHRGALRAVRDQSLLRRDHEEEHEGRVSVFRVHGEEEMESAGSQAQVWGMMRGVRCSVLFVRVVHDAGEEREGRAEDVQSSVFRKPSRFPFKRICDECNL